MAGIRGVLWAQLDETLMKGGSHLMILMTFWSALLTGLYKDYRELFTESGPFFFFCTSFLCLP